MKFTLSYSASLIALQIILGVGTAEALPLDYLMEKHLGVSQPIARRVIADAGPNLSEATVSEKVQAAKAGVEAFTLTLGAQPSREQEMAVTYATQHWGVGVLVPAEINALADLLAINRSGAFTQVHAQNYVAAVGPAKEGKLLLAKLTLDSTDGELTTSAVRVAGLGGVVAVIPNPTAEEIQADMRLRTRTVAVGVTQIVAPTTDQIKATVYLQELGQDANTALDRIINDCVAMINAGMAPRTLEYVTAYSEMRGVAGLLTPTSLEEIDTYKEMVTAGIHGINHLNQVKVFRNYKDCLLGSDIETVKAAAALEGLGFEINEDTLASAYEFTTLGIVLPVLTAQHIDSLMSLADYKERQALVHTVQADPTIDLTAAGTMNLVQAVAKAQDIHATAAAITGADQLAAANVLVGQSAPLSASAISLLTSIDAAVAAATTAAAAAGAGAAQVANAIQGVAPADAVGLAVNGLMDAAAATAATAAGALNDATHVADRLKNAVIEVSKKGLVVTDQTYIATAALQRIGTVPLVNQNVAAAEALLRTGGLRVVTGAGMAALTPDNMTADHVRAAQFFMTTCPKKVLTSEILRGAAFISQNFTDFNRDLETIEAAGEIITYNQAIQPTQEQITLFRQASPLTAPGHFSKGDVIAALVAFNTRGAGAVHNASARAVKIWIAPDQDRGFLDVAVTGRTGARLSKGTTPVGTGNVTGVGMTPAERTHFRDYIVEEASAADSEF